MKQTGVVEQAGVEQGGQADLDVPRETRQRLDIYLELLRRWSPRINLISAADLARIETRHVADSLQLLPLLPSGAERGIDLGSGAGFPGLLLAMASGIPFDLVEADGRKAAFLREAARATATPATVHAVRIEAAALPPAPVITARALAPLDRLLTLAAPLLRPGGVCLFPKGAGAEAELTAARRQWHMQVDRVPSRTQPESCILVVRDPRRANTSA